MKRSQVKTWICVDCGNAFLGKEGCNSKYCEKCRILSHICKGCRKEFLVQRREHNGRRGVYCNQKCYFKHINKSMPRGEKNGKWIDGRSKRPNYHQPYKTAYRARKRGAKGHYTFEEWETIKKKYNYMCLCCKRFEPEIKLTVDHIVPLSMGGTNDISNIQPLCFSCNGRKHIKTINFIEQYAEINR